MNEREYAKNHKQKKNTKDGWKQKKIGPRKMFVASSAWMISGWQRRQTRHVSEMISYRRPVSRCFAASDGESKFSFFLFSRRRLSSLYILARSIFSSERHCLLFWPQILIRAGLNPSILHIDFRLNEFRNGSHQNPTVDNTDYDDCCIALNCL